MIYGDLDQSYKYIGLLNSLKSSKFKVEIVNVNGKIKCRKSVKINVKNYQKDI